MSDKPLSEKQYRLTHEIRPEYDYFLIICDEINYAIARSYWDDIIEVCDRSKSLRLLVDKNIRDELSTLDEFRMASEIAAGPIKRLKLALCDRHVSHSKLKFGETVATNRGLNMRSFVDVTAAEKWLLAA